MYFKAHLFYKSSNMKITTFYLFIISYLITGCQGTPSNENVKRNVIEPTSSSVKYAMVIHGGAGTILKENMSPEKEKAYRDALNKALIIGGNILKEGGTGMDAVVETIGFMEDSPLFNAGKGAVFANDGTNKLDASIMNGKDKNAGAICGVSTIKHPIEGAKAVMLSSDHVLLAGKGAEVFCASLDLEQVDPKYFFTQRRWDNLQDAISKEKSIGYIDNDYKYGTVGAVALDMNGNIVAGTSTGGMTNKRFDRIGDSPIIGAGTYADNATCGVSCTGHGEYFIRYAAAYDVAAQMAYGHRSLEEAADYTIFNKLKNAGGNGGLIALDRYGNVTMPFNTKGMYRGYINDTESFIAIYDNE